MTVSVIFSISGLIYFIIGISQKNDTPVEKKRYSYDFDVNGDMNFENIKKQAYDFYNSKGFNVVVDNEILYLIKDHTGKSYVQVENKNNKIKISTFGTVKPNFIEGLSKFDSTQQLIMLGKLLEKGLIDEDEFKSRKANLL